MDTLKVTIYGSNCTIKQEATVSYHLLEESGIFYVCGCRVEEVLAFLPSDIETDIVLAIADTIHASTVRIFKGVEYDVIDLFEEESNPEMMFI